MSQNRPFACTWPGCTRALSNSNSLARHLAEHRNGRRFMCPWQGCGLKTAQKITLERHARRHDGPNPHACSSKGCRSAFATLEMLKAHRREVHPNIEQTEDNDVVEQDGPTPSQSKKSSSLRAKNVPTSTNTTPTPSSSSSTPAAAPMSKPLALSSRPRLDCSQLHCPYSTHKPSRLVKHATRHTAVLPFLCLEKRCLAAFATGKDVEEHGRIVHGKGTATALEEEPKKKGKRKRKHHTGNDLGRDTVDILEDEEIPAPEVAVAPAPTPKRRRLEVPLTPPASEMPRKGKDRQKESQNSVSPSQPTQASLAKPAKILLNTHRAPSTPEASAHSKTATSTSAKAPNARRPGSVKGNEQEQPAVAGKKKRKRERSPEPEHEFDVNVEVKVEPAHTHRKNRSARVEPAAKKQKQEVAGTDSADEEVGDSNSDSKSKSNGPEKAFTKDDVQAKIDASMRPLLKRIGVLKKLVRKAVEAREQ